MRIRHTSGRRIRALGDGDEGMFSRWAGDDWMVSALLDGRGAATLTKDERDVGFAGAEGLRSLKLLDRFVKEGGMPNRSTQAAQQAFAVGKLGMLYWRKAVLRGTVQQVGRHSTSSPVRCRCSTGRRAAC